MASNGIVTNTKAKNPAFKALLNQVLATNALTVLGGTTAVAVGASGYPAYKKLMDFYTICAKNPEIYAEAFARLALGVDDTRDVETDVATATGWLSAGAPLSIERTLAGVTLGDDL
jgi:hypothetical protein